MNIKIDKKKDKEIVDDAIFLVPIILLSTYLLFRILNLSKILFTFPLRQNNDVPAYMSLLFFLKQYGFHNFVPNWYNGFILFENIQPGWYFFTLPLYLLTKNILYATYISVILMLLIGFLAIYFIGKSDKISKTRTILFFLFFFVNAVNIGNFFVLGRVTEMFGWVSFLILAAVTFYYKDKKLDWKFLLFFVPSLFMVILSHFSETILAGFLIISLIIVKNLKERLVISAGIAISLLLSAFWWVPFFSNVFSTNLAGTYAGLRLIELKGVWFWDNIAIFIVIIALWFTFFIYIKTKQDTKDIKFFLPILLLSLLVFFRVIIFVPFFNQIYPDSYAVFFIFFSSYFLLNTYYVNKKFKRIVIAAVLLLPILSIVISLIHTPIIRNATETERDMASLLSFVQDRFIMLKTPSEISGAAVYSFAAIYYNLSTAGGFSDIIPSPDYIESVGKTTSYMNSADCLNLNNKLININVTEVIGYDKDCLILEQCNLSIVKKIGNFCLYKIK